MDLNVCFILAAGILAVALVGIPIAFAPAKTRRMNDEQSKQM